MDPLPTAIPSDFKYSDYLVDCESKIDFSVAFDPQLVLTPPAAPRPCNLDQPILNCTPLTLSCQLPITPLSHFPSQTSTISMTDGSPIGTIRPSSLHFPHQGPLLYTSAFNEACRRVANRDNVVIQPNFSTSTSLPVECSVVATNQWETEDAGSMTSCDSPTPGLLPPIELDTPIPRRTPSKRNPKPESSIGSLAANPSPALKKSPKSAIKRNRKGRSNNKKGNTPKRQATGRQQLPLITAYTLSIAERRPKRTTVNGPAAISSNSTPIAPAYRCTTPVTNRSPSSSPDHKASPLVPASVSSPSSDGTCDAYEAATDLEDVDKPCAGKKKKTNIIRSAKGKGRNMKRRRPQNVTSASTYRRKKRDIEDGFEAFFVELEAITRHRAKTGIVLTIRDLIVGRLAAIKAADANKGSFYAKIQAKMDKRNNPRPMTPEDESDV